MMKNLMLVILIGIGIFSCKTTDQVFRTSQEINAVDNDTVRIASDKTEYEIIIIEPGFNFWLQSIARPEGHYSQQFLENRNRQYVVAWNNRVLDPTSFDPNLYELQINYDSNIDYGYEVNYKLYYYFIYFQLQYKQQLTGLTPRI